MQSITGSNKWSRRIKQLTSQFLLLFALLIAPNSRADPPFELPAISELEKIRSAELITTKGRLIFELFPVQSPWHVANFKYLSDIGFYRDKPFHILIKDYIVQTGQDRDKKFKYIIPPEFNNLTHSFGTLGMARPADYLNPQRASSATQFHILLGEAPKMNGSYTIFGKLRGGKNVLEQLEQNDRILNLIVYVSE